MGGAQADWRKANKRQKTALDYAEERQQPAAAAVLRDWALRWPSEQYDALIATNASKREAAAAKAAACAPSPPLLSFLSPALSFCRSGEDEGLRAHSSSAEEPEP